MSQESNQLSMNELIHYTNQWCKSIGLKSKDLDHHLAIDDVIMLVNFRDEFWYYMDYSERGVWAAIWSWTYHKQFKLKQKHLDKLEIVAKSAVFKQEKRQQRLETIKALRQRIANAHETKNDKFITEG